MKRSETTEQIELFNWAKRWEHYEPALGLLYHVPNEGKRQNGAVLKAMGLRSGVPDVVLPWPGVDNTHGLYIELKYGDNTPTIAQRKYMELLRAAGYRAAVAYSAEEAKDIIRAHLHWPDGFCLSACELMIGLDDTCIGMGAPRCASCKYKRS
ncbi:MAG: VRR-NUC domain-containing protein [Lachnospiraceae bacterium]|nr:VRR-NUC domain-containing protein [Lachnospiraceae bacterium]